MEEKKEKKEEEKKEEEKKEEKKEKEKKEKEKKEEEKEEEMLELVASDWEGDQPAPARKAAGLQERQLPPSPAVV